MKNDKKNQDVGSGYRKVLQDDVSLARFLKGTRRFERLFCEGMTEGRELTLRLEVRMSQNVLIHCRVGTDEFDRNPGK